MQPLKKVFLLPCSGCDRDLEVVSGQAGGHVECGGCGRRNEVPKLRDLGALRLKTATSGGGRGQWGFAEGVMLAGGICFVLGTLLGWWMGATPKTAIDVATTRSNIEAGDDLLLYETLLQLERAPVERPPLPQEFELQRRARSAAPLSRAFYLIGGLGAATAIAAAATRFTGRRGG